jgi:exodeoxyribonuclease V gamma subunit
VLHLTTSDDVHPLATALAEVLATPLADPMAPEWVAVPTEGMHRWLKLELARTLGAAGPGTGDGVTANIHFAFPGALRQAVLAAARPDPADERSDPWRVEHLVWAVLEVLRARADDDGLGPLRTLPDGATWYGRARRLADLFDRYALRRPDLIRHWHAGHDVDATGRPLAPAERWQPHLWRATRARVGEPSPPERMPQILEQVRAGSLTLDLPSRLAVFGVTTLPGGAPFLDLAEAVAARHDLHLFLLDPSPTATARVQAASLAAPPGEELLRADDHSDDAVTHPLLRSWGRPYRERTVLLAATGNGAAAPADPPPTADPATLLARLQHDLRTDDAPAGDFVLDPADRSVQVHSCHGQARQVEVLRDAILHLLAADPTLREDDVVVLCPAIDEYAPLVEAGYGPSADAPRPPATSTAGPAGAPRLAYRVTDRTLRETYPVLAALDTVLTLVAGRVPASAVLELCALGPVRARFDFDDDAVATIGRWVTETNVRWGLDGPHRAQWGVPAELTANSWRAALDRVLMGVAVSDDDLSLAAGGIAPFGVESGDIAVAGRFADLLAHVAAIADDVTRPRAPDAWCAALAEVSDRLFAAEPNQQWQLDRLRQVVAEIGDHAMVGERPADVELTLADIRRLLADRLQGAPRRPDFFRGGVTVSSLTPLRWLPFRVVGLLGFDEAGTGGGVTDGDDLAALAPRLGDRDPRAEARQSLLEAVLAAGDHLVITRTGHDIRTNQEIPPAVAFAELRDTITATLAPTADYSVRRQWREQIETVHPHQPFDERCFAPEALRPDGPWSFDPGALAGAHARRTRDDEDRAPFLDSPLAPAPHDGQVFTLAELAAFLNHPVKAFLRGRLGIHLPSEESQPSDDLPTELGGLAAWAVASRLIDARLAGRSTDEWARYERALGTLPAGGLGDTAVTTVAEAVDRLFAAAATHGVALQHAEPRPFEVGLGDGTRVVGVVDDRGGALGPGPARITYSRARPTQHLAAWLDLVALVAHDPGPEWRSVTIRRSKDGKKVDVLELFPRGIDADERRAHAIAALEVVVDCYRRAQCEPVPLFATLSRKLHDGDAKPTDWIDGYNGSGDGDDDANGLAFGAVTLDELRALPARADDPPGARTGRAERFADYLWGAVERAAGPPDDDADDPDADPDLDQGAAS